MDLLSIHDFFMQKGRPHGHRFGKKPGDKECYIANKLKKHSVTSFSKRTVVVISLSHHRHVHVHVSVSLFPAVLFLFPCYTLFFQYSKFLREMATMKTMATVKSYENEVNENCSITIKKNWNDAHNNKQLTMDNKYTKDDIDDCVSYMH